MYSTHNFFIISWEEPNFIYYTIWHWPSLCFISKPWLLCIFFKYLKNFGRWFHHGIQFYTTRILLSNPYIVPLLFLFFFLCFFPFFYYYYTLSSRVHVHNLQVCYICIHVPCWCAATINSSFTLGISPNAIPPRYHTPWQAPVCDVPLPVSKCSHCSIPTYEWEHAVYF